MAVRDKKDVPQELDTIQQHRPTIAERLAARQRVFLEGDPDLSERETRKRIAHDVVDTRTDTRRQ